MHRRLGLAAAVLVAACGDSTSPHFDIEREFSFESDLQGWVADTADTGEPPVDWTVERSTEQAIAGDASAKIEVDNLNDAAKVWIERPFHLLANTTYQVTVGYDLATRDFGSINLWTLITGVTATSPETAADLVFQGDTGSGSDQDQGYVWLPKSHAFTVTTGADGMLHVAIGVWGTFETVRSYYIDDVQITFAVVE